jgi:ankyrin repeat protein
VDGFLAAIADNDIELFRSLLSRNPGLVNAASPQGVSVTLLTIYHRRPELTRLLVEAGAAVGVFEAAALGATSRLMELTARDPGCVNRFSPDGFQPLGLAAFFGHTEAALLLLERGADARAPSRNSQGVAPLHSAAASDSVRIAAALLEKGADVNARQQGGYTALHAAARNGSVEMVRLLLVHGADCTARNDAGELPLEVPNRKNRAEVDPLLGACADRTV